MSLVVGLGLFDSVSVIYETEIRKQYTINLPEAAVITSDHNVAGVSSYIRPRLL